MKTRERGREEGEDVEEEREGGGVNGGRPLVFQAAVSMPSPPPLTQIPLNQTVIICHGDAQLDQMSNAM